MQFQDALTIDATRRKSADGYVGVRARSARAGIYDYLGREVDPEGKTFKADQVVKVYRPADEVFAADSLGSFIARPITNDHPAVAVTADNWREHARGTVMRAVPDGEFVGFDLAFLDAGIIADLDSGKRELSNGYSCDLAIEAGTSPDGQTYDAVQRKIRGNHVALVDRGRAGSQCRVTDKSISDGGNGFAACDANPQAIEDLKRIKGMNFIMLDGLKVDLDDGDAVKALVTKLQDSASKAETALSTALTAHDKALAAKDAEIDGLKAKVVDQATIDKLANDKADVVSRAKAVCGDKLPDTAGKTVAEVRRMACDAKGVEVADKSDDYIEARFDALTADANVEPNHDPIKAPRAMNTDNASVRDFARASQY